MSGPLSIVVAGLGARARTWLQVIAANPDLRVTGLCDPQDAARDRAAAQFPDAAMGPTLDAVLRPGTDAVLLCTPPAGRTDLIEACCRAGAAILAEKPLADTLVDAARFVRLAEDAGIPLIVGLNFRYLAVTQEMRRLFRTSTVGRPEFGRFLYERWRDGHRPGLNRYPLTMAHPMLWEQSVHHFDLMRFVYDTDCDRLFARTFNPSWSMYDGDANVAAILDFADGLTLTYQGTWAGNLDRLDFDWRTDCTEGAVVQRSMFGDLAVGRRDDGALSDVPLPAGEPWITEATELLRGFVATLRGTAPAECTGRDHLRSLAMVAGCIASSMRGEPVELTEFAPLTDAAAQS